jgi:hypothetical protein
MVADTGSAADTIVNILNMGEKIEKLKQRKKEDI